jgi:hypothetical protein
MFIIPSSDNGTYGVLLLVVSERIMSIPPFLTAARTDFDEPMSTPIYTH